MKNLRLFLLLAFAGAGVNAQPTFEAWSTAYESSATATAHACNYPATVNAGDLLILIGSWVDNLTTGSVTGFTAISINDDSNSGSSGSWYRDAVGDEDGSTVDLDLSATESAVCIMARFSGAEDPATQAPVAGTANPQSSTTTWSPPVSATVASDDYLGIGYSAIGGSPGTPGGGDTDRQDLESAFDGGIAALAASYASFSGTSWTPSANTGSSSRNAVSQTLVIYPAAGGGGVTDVRLMQRLKNGYGPHESQQLGGLLQ